jgi:colicin import membrane protein
MRSLMSSGLLSVLAATALCGSACKRTSTEDSTVSASKQVEEAQRESKEAYDRAKESQDDAIDEQREATRAQDKVNEKRQELAEAEAKAAREAEESQTAQAKAQQEGEAAQAQAQAAQQRASHLQQQQVQESQATAGAGSYAPAQARTADTHQMQTRSAQSRESDTRDYSWIKPLSWNSAPTGVAPEASADTKTDEVTSMVQSTAAATVLDNALLSSVSATDISVTTEDSAGFHMINAKLSADTRIVKDGHAATLADIKQGDHVKVSYHMDNAQPIADSIEILSGGQ